MVQPGGLSLRPGDEPAAEQGGEQQVQQQVDAQQPEKQPDVEPCLLYTSTADLGDVNMIDPFHLAAYGETTVNYNRDVEIFPVLSAMFTPMSVGDL